MDSSISRERRNLVSARVPSHFKTQSTKILITFANSTRLLLVCFQRTSQLSLWTVAEDTEFSLLPLGKFTSKLYGKLALNSINNFICKQASTRHQLYVSNKSCRRSEAWHYSWGFIWRKKNAYSAYRLQIFRIHNYINIVYMMIVVLWLRHSSTPACVGVMEGWKGPSEQQFIARRSSSIRQSETEEIGFG
jgi:hypothetical protein